MPNGRIEQRLIVQELSGNDPPTQPLDYLPHYALHQTDRCPSTLRRPEGKNRLDGMVDPAGARSLAPMAVLRASDAPRREGRYLAALQRQEGNKRIEGKLSPLKD